MRNSLRMLIALAFAGSHAMAQVTIPVVHTWGDLQNAPKLTMTPSHPTDTVQDMPPALPVAFQVGISGGEAFTNGAVVLYFLGSTGSENPYAPEQWGVYWLQVDGQPWEANTNTQHFVEGGTKPPGTLFCAQTFSFQTAGDHVIELIKPFPFDNSKPEARREALARATIHVQDNPEALWYPLWTTQDFSGGAASGRNADGTQFALESVFNPQGNSANPSPPRPRWYTGFPAMDQALPGLFPRDAAGSQVQLKMDDATLIVTFAPKIEGFFPDDYFLTRWWVNGKPGASRPESATTPSGACAGIRGTSPFSPKSRFPTAGAMVIAAPGCSNLVHAGSPF